MKKYIVLAGGTEEDMPNGYPEVHWVYLGEIKTDAPPEEVPELLHRVSLQDGYDLLAEEISVTASRAEKIRVIEVEEDTVLNETPVNV